MLKKIYKQRAPTVESPFGTLKQFYHIDTIYYTGREKNRKHAEPIRNSIQPKENLRKTKNNTQRRQKIHNIRPKNNKQIQNNLKLGNNTHPPFILMAKTQTTQHLPLTHHTDNYK